MDTTHAEGLAIAQALYAFWNIIDKISQPGSAIVVYSDSQPVLYHLHNFYEDGGRVGNPVLEGVTEIIMVKSRELEKRGISVNSRWIPSHQHVPGNKMAD